MGNSKTNHFYIDKNYSDFFNESKILNAERVDAVLKRENFVLLAAYGYYTGFKTPFENPKAKGSDVLVMNQLNSEQLSVIYAIAIADTGELDVVNDDVKVGNIVMEYANTGIIELKKLEENARRGNEIKKFQANIRDVIDNIQ